MHRFKFFTLAEWLTVCFSCTDQSSYLLLLRFELLQKLLQLLSQLAHLLLTRRLRMFRHSFCLRADHFTIDRLENHSVTSNRHVTCRGVAWARFPLNQNGVVFYVPDLESCLSSVFNMNTCWEVALWKGKICCMYFGYWTWRSALNQESLPDLSVDLATIANNFDRIVRTSREGSETLLKAFLKRSHHCAILLSLESLAAQ